MNLALCSETWESGSDEELEMCFSAEIYLCYSLFIGTSWAMRWPGKWFPLS